MSARALLIVLLVLGSGLAYHSCTVDRLQRRAAELALRADSTAAALDTTRVLARRALDVLGAELHGVERRVIQERQRADALDRALGRERIARADVEARVRRLDSLVAGTPVTDSGGVRVGTWDLRDPPYTVQARAELPPPPDTGRLRLAIALDPIRLGLRLGCGEARDGIRPATATLLGPPWAQLALDSLSQDPGLCRSPALERRGPSRLKWAVIGAGVVEGIRQALKLLGR